MGTVVDTKYGYLASGIILVIVPSIPLLAVLLVPSDDPFPFLVVLTLVPIVKSFVLLVKIKSLESHPVPRLIRYGAGLPSMILVIVPL